MARENFISDHLVDMRDRLKQNCAAARQRTETVADAAASEEKTVPAAPSPALPSLQAERSRTDTDRERRDLEGRLLRDLAAVEVEIPRLEARHQETLQFQETLRALCTDLKQLEEGEAKSPADYAKHVEEMRLRYFQAFGRFSAGSLVAGTVPEKPEQEALTPWQKAVPFIAGMVLAALLISAAIVFSLAF